MPKYILRYDNGYGNEYKIVETENEKVANDIAYDLARENWENFIADYEAIPYSKEAAIEAGLEDEECE